MTAANNLDVVNESQPVPSPELLSIATTPTHDAAGGTVGMAPPEGSRGILREGEGLCQGSPSDDISNNVRTGRLANANAASCTWMTLPAYYMWVLQVSVSP